MIKIHKKECPLELTEDLKEQLTEEFRKTGKAVWKQDFIVKALLESSHSKCCYCECKIDRESKYMEVEHYHDKKHNDSLVVDWDNLLPSCKRCNGRKSTFNTVREPFINPANIDPKEHLIISSYRLYPKSPEGKNTIDVLLLNDRKRLVLPRFEIADAVINQIDELLSRVEDYNNGTRKTHQNRSSILGAIEYLMLEGLAEAEYSATVATTLLENIKFREVIRIIKIEGLWDEALDELYEKVCENKLDTDINTAQEFLKDNNS
ncbi:HNH endonuclease [Bacillus haikouensis]|nr:HNH endonuclease [Bacillus haikouensis]